MISTRTRTGDVNVKAVIDRFCSSAPVDVHSLAEALGVRVLESESLPPDLAGKLVEDAKLGGSKGYAILIPKSHSFERKRFTAAHLLAHFVLHRDRIGSLLTDDDYYRSNLGLAAEIEANRLAADILMPDALMPKHAERRDINVAELARRFQVSEPVMRVRLSV